jgi:hypothetical protein
LFCFFFFSHFLFPFILGQKRPSDGNSGLMAKKQKRTPKRTNAIAKNEKNGTGGCFPMLAFIQW